MSVVIFSWNSIILFKKTEYWYLAQKPDIYRYIGTWARILHGDSDYYYRTVKDPDHKFANE